MPQMFADAVGLPLGCVEQVMGDTDLTADAGKSSASRQTFVSGNAAQRAGSDLRRQLLERLGFAADDAEVVFDIAARRHHRRRRARCGRARDAASTCARSRRAATTR